MKTKMVHATMKIIWAQKWKKFPVVKDEWKKRVLSGALL